MTSDLSFTALLGTFVLAAGCGSSGIRDTPEATGLAAGADVAPAPTPRPCSPSATLKPAADGLISDFSGAGNGIPARIITYTSPKSVDPSAVTYTTAGGKLTMSMNAPAISSPQLLGAVLAFDGCVDASEFAGVEFAISGSFSGASLISAAVDEQHQDATLKSRFATGPAGSYPPQQKISATALDRTPRIVKLPFASSDIQGNPPAPVDPGKLINVVWQFIVPIAPDNGDIAETGTGSITIEEVKLYR